MNEELTFAEAMALDPKDAEVCFDEHWYLLREIADSYTLATFRCAKFRRARPKRSRVQEMVDTLDGQGDNYTRYAAYDMASAIRAVCKWLRDRIFDGTDGNDIAIALEREFLGPQ